MIAVRLAAAACCVLAGAWQSPRDLLPPKADGTATITGTVLDANGSPLAGARVAATPPFDSKNPLVRIRSSQSDSAGRYSIEALPAGSYTVEAVLPGYTPTAFGATAHLDTPVSVVLAEGERFNAPIVLSGLSAVSGTIVDEYGMPAVATVTFLARMTSVQRGTPIWDVAILDEVARVESDRRGRYRIEGLPRNRYFVRAVRETLDDMQRIDPETIARAREAIERPSSAVPAGDSPKTQRLSYVPVYYPGVTNSSAATTVDVAPGVERASIDLQLQLHATTTLEGELIDANGALVANAAARLLGDDEGLNQQVTTKSDGRFRFARIPGGRYVIAARYALPPQPGGKRTMWWGSQELFVNPSERFAPVLKLDAGTDISGTVAFNGDGRPPTRGLLAQLVPLTGPFAYFQLPAAMPTTGTNPDATLSAVGISFEGVPPGRYLITPMPVLSEGWSGRSATLGGVDVSTIPFDVIPGQPLTDLVVTYSRATTTLTGFVRNANGEPVFAHTLVVFPADLRARVPTPINRVRGLRPDSRGRYEVRGLPPGDYLLALTSDLQPSDITPEVLQALESGALRVRLVEGQLTVQDLQAATGR